MTNEELVTKIQNDEDVADNMLALWQQNQGLIAMIARKYSTYEDIEDLIQQGYIGLWEAVANYDKAAGALFSTYATFWIRKSIHTYVEECSALVRVPYSLTNLIIEYHNLVSSTFANHGRKPTDEEAKKHLNISGKRMEQLKEALKVVFINSLNTPIGDEADNELYEIVAGSEDVEGEVLDRLELEELKALLWGMVKELPEGQAQIIKSRYIDNKSYNDIIRETGKSKGEIKSEENKALRTLSHSKGSGRLKCFLPEYHAGRNGVSVSSFNRTWTSATEKAAIKLCK